MRYRVWLHFLRSVLDNKLPFVGMRHLWFPTMDTLVYELRTGNAPANRDRPNHLRNLRLEVDATEIPDWLREAMRPGGTVDDMTEEAVRENGLEGQDIHTIRTEIFARFAKRLAEKGLQ